ncbi:MAG: twin-arginine translocase TatA/TatE family subunit [Candidatus Moranbacteria bacterium]|jgi:sec-independent protein translocase protein TatA|nr:twin-arginine translocase TatA/TatE family subunit [Candidatus Moranbacteria bacterium]
MFDVGANELLLVAIVLIFLFGAKKIPDLADGLGNAIRQFKKALKDDESDAKK